MPEQIISPAFFRTGRKGKPNIGQNRERSKNHDSVLFSSQENGNTNMRFLPLSHYDLAPWCTNNHQNQLDTESQIVEMIRSAVKIEMEFVAEVLPVELIGTNSAMMCNYIKFGADRLLITFGCHRRYKVGIHLNEWKR
jgi:hypothetical protein